MQTFRKKLIELESHFLSSHNDEDDVEKLSVKSTEASSLISPFRSSKSRNGTWRKVLLNLPINEKLVATREF